MLQGLGTNFSDVILIHAPDDPIVQWVWKHFEAIIHRTPSVVPHGGILAGCGRHDKRSPVAFARAGTYT
jgi:hypothetical protein